MSKRIRPPAKGYVVVNPDGCFGLYRTKQEANDECTFPSDKVYRYRLDPVQKRLATADKEGEQ